MLDSLSSIAESETEKQILDKIWQYTYTTEIEDGTENENFNLYLSVLDATGKQVANELQSAKGKIKAELTISCTSKKWSKTVVFVPVDKDNLYLLMRE